MPDRGAAADEVPPNALPVQLAYQLIHDVGLPETQVAGMTLAQAIEVMSTHWSQPRD